MMSRESMKLALEALELLARYENPSTKIQVRKPKDRGLIVTMYPHKVATEAAALLRKRLAQPEQEPVAWRTFDGEGGYDYRSYEMNENYDKEWAERNPNHAHWVEPLYTSPQKQWVGLTADEIWKCNKAKSGSAVEFHICSAHQNVLDFAESIEAKLKEKNA